MSAHAIDYFSIVIAPLSMYKNKCKATRNNSGIFLPAHVLKVLWLARAYTALFSKISSLAETAAHLDLFFARDAQTNDL